MRLFYSPHKIQETITKALSKREKSVDRAIRRVEDIYILIIALFSRLILDSKH